MSAWCGTPGELHAENLGQWNGIVFEDQREHNTRNKVFCVSVQLSCCIKLDFTRLLQQVE